MPGTEEDPLERLRRKLYGNKAVSRTPEAGLSSVQPGAPERWSVPQPVPAAPRKISGPALFLGIAVGVFIIAGIISAVTLYLGGRSVSADRVAIAVEGPTTVAGAEAVSLLVTIKNDNPVAITDVSMTLMFPDGTTEAGDTSVALAQHTESLGDIAPGETVRRTVRATFFGTENQNVSIPITVEYRTSNSNAVFVKKDTYAFTISTSPVGLSITTLSEVISGQSMTLTVLVRSNASAPLENVAVRATYPQGFVPQSTTPEAIQGNLFVLGTLQEGEEREIRVTGTLLGQDGDERVFRFESGALRSESSREIATPYTEKDAPVTVVKPFFAVNLSLNGSNEQEVVVEGGEQVSGSVRWTNALSSAIRDGAISIALSGEALDTGTIVATNGFYRSADKTIRYDRDTTQGLDLLNPGDTGNGTFSFMVKDADALRALRNPTITLTISVAGRRIGENNVAESVNSTLVRTLKVATDVSFEMDAVRTVGPYENTGPWPPRAETESTYTIRLSAANTVNSVARTAAKMTLPSYVRFTGKSDAGITYNESTREVTWTVGDLAPAGSKAAAFQVALLPSASQQGTTPVLVSGAVLTGFDRFVQEDVQDTAPSVDTAISEDPAYSSGKGTVTP